MSLTTAMVRVPGEMRLSTSSKQSVCIRRPSKAPGRDNLACDFGVR